MKIVIVDDEELALMRLKRLLNELGYGEVEVAKSAHEALELTKKSHFDVAFLDINMPQMDGLELGYALRYADANLAIIYQSAYDNHALKAFDIGAVGYLVKPYGKEELQRTLERVVAQKRDQEVRFLTKCSGSYLLLKPSDIYYIKADLSEVIIRSKESFSYVAKKISELETMLQPFGFHRVHRSYLVNLEKIGNIETIEQSRLQFHFRDISDIVESSKDGAKEFREHYLL